MIRHALKLIRADVLAHALLSKWDETDPRVRAAIADRTGIEHIDHMAQLVSANVRSVDPVIVADLKRQVKPFDIQCKKWDYTRKRSTPAAGPEVEAVEGGSVEARS